MWLKAGVTLSFLAGAFLMAGWPLIVGAPPKDRSDKQALADYASRSTTLFGILLAIFFLTAVLAWLVVRRARAEFREVTRRNLEELIEGTLRDHERRGS